MLMHLDPCCRNSHESQRHIFPDQNLGCASRGVSRALENHNLEPQRTTAGSGQDIGKLPRVLGGDGHTFIEIHPNEGKTAINHPPVITIGGMVTIPNWV